MWIVPAFYFKLLPSANMFEWCVNWYSLCLHKQQRHSGCHANNKPKLIVTGKVILLHTTYIVLIRWELLMLANESFCTCGKWVSTKIKWQKVVPVYYRILYHMGSWMFTRHWWGGAGDQGCLATGGNHVVRGHVHSRTMQEHDRDWINTESRANRHGMVSASFHSRHNKSASKQSTIWGGVLIGSGGGWLWGLVDRIRTHRQPWRLFGT